MKRSPKHSTKTITKNLTNSSTKDESLNLFSDSPKPDTPAAGGGASFLDDRLKNPNTPRKSGRKTKAEEEAELRAKIEAENRSKETPSATPPSMAIEAIGKAAFSLLAALMKEPSVNLSPEEARDLGIANQQAIDEVFPPEWNKYLNVGACGCLWLALLGGKVALAKSRRSTAPKINPEPEKRHAEPPQTSNASPIMNNPPPSSGLTAAEAKLAEGSKDGFELIPTGGRRKVVIIKK